MPTNCPGAQSQNEYEKNNCPRNRIKNRQIPCDSIWIPMIVLEI